MVLSRLVVFLPAGRRHYKGDRSLGCFVRNCSAGVPPALRVLRFGVVVAVRGGGFWAGGTPALQRHGVSSSALWPMSEREITGGADSALDSLDLGG